MLKKSIHITRILKFPDLKERNHLLRRLLTSPPFVFGVPNWISYRECSGCCSGSLVPRPITSGSSADATPMDIWALPVTNSGALLGVTVSRRRRPMAPILISHVGVLFWFVYRFSISGERGREDREKKWKRGQKGKMGEINTSKNYKYIQYRERGRERAESAKKKLIN